ncbi:MAG: asparagine synthase (glutamine-hydrolyzing), partial [Candidatus Aenigmarchaeota archaeon]|nr:asparagine synthase (glutamine-hydrolyzing) [Candidatus Aenigmarchaeota archaeon]
MCGITGFVGFSDKRLIKKMTDSIKHRGPDGCGYYINDSVCLGHRRLSIIDTSTGDQPMYNEEGDVVVVFNGEIYNYLELRKNLSAKKHKFKSNSDTEVLVHLWEEYGKDMVKKLRGMFAFAIWDDSKKVLFTARDHIGIKPFYYCFNDKVLVFASEIKAILKWEGYDKSVDRRSLNDYLAFGYVSGEKTMFSGVKKLLPGHCMMFRNGKVDIKKYWKPEFSESVKNENVAVSTLNKLFDESVKIRLMSDVPFGAFLSGGVDSSLIVAMMSKHMDEPVKTFSVGFGEADDELPYARLVADKFGTDHTEKIVEPDDLLKHIGSIIKLNDDCVVDPAMLPTYVISKVASRRVKMVLSGEGGDENFGGYERYGILEKPWFAPRSLRFLRYRMMITLIRDKERKMLLQGVGYHPEGQVMRPFISGNKLNDVLSFEQKTYLPDD